jgi:[protein-PII] uridylyltransferase
VGGKVRKANLAKAASLRARVQESRERAFTSVIEGGSGVPACRAFSDFFDELLGDAWRAAGGENHGLALVATGGWGRRELSPYSDIDFLILSGPGEVESARRLAESLLYPLWDSGVAVGHAVRTPAECARLAPGDIATATAMLDSRLIVGSGELSQQLVRLTRRAIAPGGNPNQFITQLGDEMTKRHERFGGSLYLLEPNLKQGIGGLRDLLTALWAARVRWETDELEDLVRLGQLGSQQADSLRRAKGFLLMLRSLLQMGAGRRTDQLTFESQERIGPKLFPNAVAEPGHVKSAVTPAVETLMRHYYLHARAVVSLAARLLEAARVPKRRRPRIARIDSSFLMFNGNLAVRDPNVFQERPEEMVRLFRVAIDLDLPVYWHTKHLVEQALEGGCGDLWELASSHFLEVLCDERDSRQPTQLETMHEVGLINALVPEFAPCTCRVQHDLYHVYTVDQHQLNAVAMLKKVFAGSLSESLRKPTSAVPAIKSRSALFLATLLHDVGKPLGKGHSEKGARVAEKVALRLGMSTELAKRVAFLVREHLTMSHLSQRRDLADPTVIRKFAERVQDEHLLAELYLLTICDTAMTAPGNLSAWKEQLLGELYARTRAHFGQADEAVLDVAAEAARRRQKVVGMVRRAGEQVEYGPLDEDCGRIETFLESLEDHFVQQLSARQLLRHARLARVREQSGHAVEFSVSHYPLKGHSEVAIIAPDAPGLLADITGAMAANRIDVLEAALGSSRQQPPLAVDLFHVRKPGGDAIPRDDPRWQRLIGDLRALREQDRSDAAKDLISRRRRSSALGNRVTPPVADEVNIINDASSESTVVEVFTRDAVGVLFAMTRCLADLGLDIRLSKVSTEGHKVADVFYVSDGGEKLGAARTAEVEGALRAALTAVQEAQLDRG